VFSWIVPYGRKGAIHENTRTDTNKANVVEKSMKKHSRFRYQLKLIVVLMLCFFWSKQVMAHDPGLSTAEVRVDQNGISIELALAPSDVERIVDIDSNLDQIISPGEFEQAKSRLLSIAADGFQIQSDNQPLQVMEQNASYDEQSSVVILRLRFSGRIGQHLELRSGMISLLARGHKQFVSLRAQDGQILYERMLGLGDDRLTYDVGSQRPAHNSFGAFLKLGIEHILTGYDHLAFLLALLLVGSSFRSAAKLISSFTVAHSLTLALATFGLVQIPSSIVEPLIAASIVYVGLENLLQGNRPNRWLLTFAFGLVHGLGFASVLRDLGIAETGNGAFVPLLSFNMGVEVGQLAIAALVLPIIWKLKKSPKFELRYVPACSMGIAVVAFYWLFQRLVM
jgi:hydrogenase/urease accessory protein HupE